MLRRRRKSRDRKPGQINEDAAKVVLRFLDASGQGEAVLDISAYLELNGHWSGRSAETADSRSGAEGSVPDDFAWGSALLDLVRSLPPVTAASVGAIAVSPPWSDGSDSVPIGMIANMFRAAEDARSAEASKSAGSA